MYKFNTIEEALEDLRAGKIILVTDDPDRENEGDLICAAEFATQANVNTMATYAKGLICMPMSKEYALNLCRRICHTSKCKYYGYICQRFNLYAYEQRIWQKAQSSADGQ